METNLCWMLVAFWLISWKLFPAPTWDKGRSHEIKEGSVTKRQLDSCYVTQNSIPHIFISIFIRQYIISCCFIHAITGEYFQGRKLNSRKANFTLTGKRPEPRKLQYEAPPSAKDRGLSSSSSMVANACEYALIRVMSSRRYGHPNSQTPGHDIMTSFNVEV